VSAAPELAGLATTPAALDALLRGVAAAWSEGNEGEGTWSARDVVRHLIHSDEVVWAVRVRFVFEHGETQAFTSVDQMPAPERFAGRPLDELLDLFAATRAASLRAVADCRLGADDLARRGRHPSLGVVTLGQLFAAWRVHDLGHVAQIARVLAKQRREDVGPWTAYLSILDPR
jgi:hypothetical protein